MDDRLTIVLSEADTHAWLDGGPSGARFRRDLRAELSDQAVEVIAYQGTDLDAWEPQDFLDSVAE